MECAHCKILILPKLHFYQCKNCSRYYHRSGCVQPVFHANFCQLKRTGWICNTCQYRDLKDINHSPFLTSTQVNQDNIAQATPDNANIVTPITTSKNFRSTDLKFWHIRNMILLKWIIYLWIIHKNILSPSTSFRLVSLHGMRPLHQKREITSRLFQLLSNSWNWSVMQRDEFFCRWESQLAKGSLSALHVREKRVEKFASWRGYLFIYLIDEQDLKQNMVE